MLFLAHQKKKKKKEKKKEPSVTVEIDIKQMNTMDKFNRFIGLCAHYHLNRCKNGPKCGNCTFTLNFRFVYVQYLISGDGVRHLQDYCHLYNRNFFSLRTFLKSLASVEREKVKVEKEFQDILKLWNYTEIDLIK